MKLPSSIAPQRTRTYAAVPTSGSASDVRLRLLTQGRSIGLLSAHNPASPDWMNVRSARSLQTQAEQAGYKTISVTADWLSNAGTAREEIRFEQSLIVVSRSKAQADDFVSHIADLSAGHGHRSLIVKPYNSCKASFLELSAPGLPAAQTAINVGAWSAHRLPELHSMLVNGKMASIPAYQSFDLRFN